MNFLILKESFYSCDLDSETETYLSSISNDELFESINNKYKKIIDFQKNENEKLLKTIRELKESNAKLKNRIDSHNSKLFTFKKI